MGVGLGGIVSIGGGTGSGSGSASGIISINSQTGPAVSVTGVNGIVVTAAGNVVTVNGASLSGLIAANPGSGITEINSQTGPGVQISGINGIVVTQPRANFILLDGASISGTSSGGGTSCYTTTFSNVTEQTFTHSLATKAIIVQIQDGNDEFISADAITAIDLNNVTVRFNSPQTGRLSVLSCGASIATSGVTKFAATFLGITSGLFTHGLNTRDVMVQIYDTSGPPRQIMPDEVILDTLDAVSLLFNTAQSGRIVIMG